MLDIFIKSIMRKLDVHVQGVRSQRAMIERERASGSPRTIATAILKHPEGYATSPREAAESAQKAYAKARREWEQQGVPMLAKLATLAIARERRDETAAVFREHEKGEAIRKATKVHPDFRRLNDIMIAHGVQTGDAATATDGIIAIMSDILMWAGADPDLQDPASPLHAILEVYAERLILTPGQFGDRSRSKPGIPVRQVKYTDPEHYMFNEAAQPVTDIAAGTKPERTLMPDAIDEDEDADGATSIDIYQSHDVVEAVVNGKQAPEATVPSAAALPPMGPVPAPSAVNDSISAEFAKRIAETVFDNNPFNLSIYWPRDGYEIGDYDLKRLIPALEKRVASGDGWSGIERFLAAARLGRAREFIEGDRRSAIERLARNLERGDERAVNDARAAGFDV